MKKIVCLAVILVVGCLALTLPVPAGEQAQQYEYAIVKWDGPDRLFYNLPNKFEIVSLEKTGIKVPKDAEAEEFCLTAAANKMAKEGWETVTLNSRRILLRRPLVNPRP